MSSWIIKQNSKKKIYINKIVTNESKIITNENYVQPIEVIDNSFIESSLDINKIIEESELVDIDFLEIGTSNFDTLLHKADPSEIGISVEPIKYYLDSMPDRSNVLKANVAITSNRESDTISIYYIKESELIKNNLPWWLKGCNKINDYHPLHIEGNFKNYVTIEEVSLINIDEFLQKYKIRGIKYLKIDTEGHDAIILNGLFDYLLSMPKKSKEYYPKEILFESNANIDKDVIDRLIERSIILGYKLISRNEDTHLILE